MNYSHHRKAQAAKEALKASQPELEKLPGHIRTEKEQEIIAAAHKIMEEHFSEVMAEVKEEKPKRGRKPKAE